MSLTENSSSVKVTKSVLGVITFPSFNITLNSMDAGIMDGLGEFLPSIPTDLLEIAGADWGNSLSHSHCWFGASGCTIPGLINLM